MYNTSHFVLTCWLFFAKVTWWYFDKTITQNRWVAIALHWVCLHKIKIYRNQCGPERQSYRQNYFYFNKGLIVSFSMQQRKVEKYDRHILLHKPLHLVVLHGTLVLSSTDHSLPQLGWHVWDVIRASDGRRMQRSQIRSRDGRPASHLNIDHHQLLFQQNHKAWRVVKLYEKGKWL